MRYKSSMPQSPTSARVLRVILSTGILAAGFVTGLAACWGLIFIDGPLLVSYRLWLMWRLCVFVALTVATVIIWRQGRRRTAVAATGVSLGFAALMLVYLLIFADAHMP